MSEPTAPLNRRGLALGVIGSGFVLTGAAALRINAPEVHSLGVLASLGVLLLLGIVTGRLASLVRLPRITGYLAAGVLCGPSVLGLLGKDDVKGLALVSTLALALIALQAGLKLTGSSLLQMRRTIVWSSLSQVLIVVPLMALLFAGASRFHPDTASLSGGALLSVAVLWGILSLARAPKATLGLISETRSSGPVTQYAVSVVVVLDVLVVVLFSLALSTAAAVRGDAPFNVSALLHHGTSLFASVAAGTTLGLLIAAYFKLFRAERLLFLLVACFFVSAFSAYSEYEPLVVFVAAGCVIVNLSAQTKEVGKAAHRLDEAVLIVFFGVAGAKVELLALSQTWPIALALVAGRVASTWLACRVGHILAGDVAIVRKFGAAALVSQAGLALGLAGAMGDAIPGAGAGIATLAVAVITLNELVGPVLFKFALGRSGEIGADAVEPDAPKTAATADEPATAARAAPAEGAAA